MGIYMVDNPTKVYSATDNSFNIKGVDLMARMTGLRNGNLEGVEYVIPQGTNVRTAIIGIISLASFNNYIVQEFYNFCRDASWIKDGVDIYEANMEKMKNIINEK